MNVTDEPQKHVKLPDEPLEIDEEDFYVRAFIKWAIEEQPELKRLETENAELRELVQDVMPIVCDGCHERLCKMPKEEHPFITCWFADRMCELGIEVD